MSIYDNITEEQLQTLGIFQERWTAADKKANGDSYYQNYQAGHTAIKECVSDFTDEQKQFIQATLDNAIPNIPKINIL